MLEEWMEKADKEELKKALWEISVLAEKVVEYRMWPDIPGSFMHEALDDLSNYF